MEEVFFFQEKLDGKLGLYEEAVRGLLKWDEKATGMQSYGATCKDNFRRSYMQGACVAQIYYLKDPVWVWVHIKSVLGNPIAERWVEFLFDPQVSPWKDIVKTIVNKKDEVKYYNKPYQPWTIDFIKKYGFVVSADFAANYLCNFIKATRMPHEYGANHFKFWDQLVQAGIHPGYAAFLQGIMKFSLNQHTVIFGGKKGSHYYMDSTNTPMSAPSRFLFAKPNTELFLQKATQSWDYQPCDCIWAEKGTSYYNNNSTYLIHLRSLLDGKSGLKKPRFLTTQLTEGADKSYSIDQLIKVALEEQQRMLKEEEENNGRYAA